MVVDSTKQILNEAQIKTCHNATKFLSWWSVTDRGLGTSQLSQINYSQWL